MALSGQASGGWTESSSALRLLHVGIRNTVGILTSDAFTMTNTVGALAGVYADPTSNGFDSSVLGILSGSCAYTRGDQGTNEIGGPDGSAAGSDPAGIVLLGVFINTAAGNDFENQPAVASDKGPYVSGQGTYANSLYETSSVASAALTYTTGDYLYASANGYITNDSADDIASTPVILGVLKMPADAVQPEIVYDQRI